MVRDDTEAHIKALLAAGKSREAAAAAYEAGAAEWRAFLTKRGLDADAVEDVLGRMRESLVKGIATYRGEASFRAWSYTVLRNAWARDRRSSGRLPVKPLENQDDVAAPPDLPRTTVAALRQLVERHFEEKDAQVLRLYGEGLSWEEIREVMRSDRSVTAWRQYGKRLLDRLRDLATRELR